MSILHIFIFFNEIGVLYETTSSQYDEQSSILLSLYVYDIQFHTVNKLTSIVNRTRCSRSPTHLCISVPL